MLKFVVSVVVAVCLLLLSSPAEAKVRTAKGVMWGSSTQIDLPKTIGGAMYIRKVLVTSNLTQTGGSFNITTTNGTVEVPVVKGATYWNFGRLLNANDNPRPFDLKLLYSFGGTIPAGESITYEIEYETGEE